MASLDPVAYLRATPPFHALPQRVFDDAARSLDVGFFPRGSRLVHVGGSPLDHLFVIRKGSVRLEREGQVIQLLEEGETFGYTSLITGKATLDVVVEEDLLAYRLPGEQFRRLLSDAQFAGHFAVGLSERLKSSLEHSPIATFRADLSLEVQTLVRRAAVWVEADATVGDAARVMRDERISSVLVRTEPPGILTDRDLRSRVLAEGLGPETPVQQVFSRPLRTVTAETAIHEAWTVLLDTGSHHLPVLRGADVAGVLTSTDLLKCTAQGPVAVQRRVERIANRESLPGYAEKVAEMASALLGGGLDAVRIAGFVARLDDALVRRLLAFAEGDLGPPPVPYAWLALGSAGRQEQTLVTGQDCALVYADEGSGHRAYFQALADAVETDLAAAGFPENPRGIHARQWHGTLSEWVQHFAGWLDSRRPQGLIEAAIFFDFRPVAGALDVAPLEAAVQSAARNTVFLRYLARAAIDLRPPGSLRLKLGGESTVVDLRTQGLAPVVHLARCYALEIGARARGTIDRLDAAAEAGIMSPEIHGAVSESYRFLLGLRLRLKLRALSENRPTSNSVALSELTAIERTRVKDTFRAVKSWQDLAAYHYQTSF
jgi:CBS domain-containing protein